MRNYRNILLLLMRNSLRKKDKNQIIAYITLGILYILLTAFGIYAINKYGSIFVGSEAEIITTTLFSGFVITIFFGTFASISLLFLSKDSEFFLALPVKPVTVFLSKLTLAYLAELVFCAMFLLPVLIALGIKLNLTGLFFALIPVMIISVPLFALVFIALISMPIMFFITLFKNRGMISTFLVIGIFAIIMVGYYYVVFSSAGNTHEVDLNPILQHLKKFSYAFYPIYMLVKFSLRQPVFKLNLAMSSLTQLGIFLGSLIVFCVLSYALTLMFYRKVNSKVLEQGAIKTKQGSFGQSSPFKALLKREFKEVMRTPMLAFQAFMGVVLCPIITGMTAYSMFSGLSEIDVTEPMINEIMQIMFWAVSTMMLFMMGVGLNPGSGFCISREGANFCYLKLLPVSYKIQIGAKHALYTITGVLTCTLSLLTIAVLSIICNMFVWWIIPVCAIGMFSWTYALCSLAIYMDLKSPKLDYKNVREITKRLKNSAVMAVWMLATMIYSIVLIIYCIQYITNAYTILAVGLAVYALSGPIFGYIFHNKLYSNVQTLFNRL